VQGPRSASIDLGTETLDLTDGSANLALARAPGPFHVWLSLGEGGATMRAPGRL